MLSEHGKTDREIDQRISPCDIMIMKQIERAVFTDEILLQQIPWQMADDHSQFLCGDSDCRPIIVR